MGDPSREPTQDVPLNPALKSRTDTTYDTDRATPAPIDTASSKGGGERWPMVWLVVTVVCVALAIYFII
jgi:hypothetical protein